MRKIVGASLVATLMGSAVAWAIGATGTDGNASGGVVQVASAASTATAAGTTVGTGSPALADPVAVVNALPAVESDKFVFGVQTHFSQNWTASWLDLARQVEAPRLRDSVPWTTAEKQAGSYDFSGGAVATLTRFCAQGGTTILTIVPKNPLYDGGHAVYTPRGQAAFAEYLAALATRFGSCLSAIEVGNEINAADALDYPAGYDLATTYVASLAVLYPRVKAVAPKVAILGGSTNTIGTGFLSKLFAAGMLRHVDGIAVHPYRSNAETLDGEVAHLNNVMASYGAPKPIWATEFSFDTQDERAQASSLVKAVTQLYASGVRNANWYALVNQRYFPLMGLFNGTAPKPAALAYRTVQQHLLPFGAPRREDPGARPVYLYRQGADRWILWGDNVPVEINRAARVRDALGNLVAHNGRLVSTSDPVLIEGATIAKIKDGTIVADSLLQFGVAPWSYLRRERSGRDSVLAWYDTNFTSHFADRWSNPLRLNDATGATAGTASNPTRAVIRYTSPKAQTVYFGMCFSKAVSGDGVDYLVQHNGTKKAGGLLTDKVALPALKVTLAAGDRIDVSFGPNQVAGGDVFSYRILVAKSVADATAMCGK